MRTTIALDDDLLDKLKKLAQKRRISLRQAVDETLRRGLSAQEVRQRRRKPFQIEIFASAFRPGVDPLRLNALVDDLEVQRFTEARSR